MPPKKQTTEPKPEAAKPTVEVTQPEHPFKRVRKRGVPIVAFESADPQATIVACQKALNGSLPPVCEWDCVRALRPINKDAEPIVAEIGPPIKTLNPVQCLALIHDAYKCRGDEKPAVFFFHAGHKLLENWQAVQGIWNLRDKLKAYGATLVLLGPSVKLPPELSNDVPLFEEPVPTPEQINNRIDSTCKDASKAFEQFKLPDPETKNRIADTLTGYLSMFGIEQSLALALDASGINLRRLWELKVANLKNTAGLEISQPETNFANLAGCYGIKKFLNMLINGRERARGVFFLDEIEKMVAGGAGDLSGTSQAMIEQFLYWTEAKRVNALLLLGVPGAGKSWTAQCLAGEMKVPLLRGSMSSVKGSLVGQSEAQMRQLLKTVDSVTSEKTLMVATCNSLDSITPEILARFKLGVFFYSYPTAEEAAALWNLYTRQYDLDICSLPSADTVRNWVGREIESCCYRAWLFNCGLADAAESVVPVCRANKDKMDALRRSVSRRFLSAAHPGVYEFSELQTEAPVSNRAEAVARKFAE